VAGEQVSAASPFAIAVVAVGGAFMVAGIEQALAGRLPSPAAVARSAQATLRQPLAVPQVKDNWLYHGAPFLLLLGAVLALAMVPWAPGFRGLDFSTGAILYSAALAYVTPAIFMAGWGSGRPLGIVGGFRFIAQMLAYEMPIVMAVTAAAAPAASLRPVEIVDVQNAVPMALAQPLAFALFVPSVMAVCFIRPFDLPQAPGELGGGAFASYTGVYAGMVELSQRVLLLGAAGMTAALFLGGWHGPLLPEAVWMALKTALVAAAMLYAGRRLPRVELPWLLSAAWKYAVPAAIVAIVWAGLITVVFYA
jgi:NADH-quinone oxidoreductase subunit H